ncbi:MAG: class I SAM-dependent methyltransferase [Candidatus Omnitrophica bacterium]|nr:class I SAM-dependent methyltransferase [Candidatus Omnitrophota bacterium]
MSPKKSSPDSKLTPIADLYTESLQEHGTRSAGVGWKDPKSHVLRFDKLLTVVQPSSGKVSVNDLGCGYGALYRHIEKSTSIKLKKYYGYEISYPMLDAANHQICNPKVEFQLSDHLTQEADYSFACGIFNVRLEQSEKAWTAYILKTLKNLAEFSVKGFAFNALSIYVDYRKDHLYYADPMFFFDYCKKNFGKEVNLLHDYPLYEWTLTVRS